jgi:hypothetical protein
MILFWIENIFYAFNLEWLIDSSFFLCNYCIVRVTHSQHTAPNPSLQSTKYQNGDTVSIEP